MFISSTSLVRAINNCVILLIFFIVPFSMDAQLQVLADKEQAVYAKSEAMNFLVSSDEMGPVHYVIRKGRYTSVLSEGTVQIVNNNPVMVPFTLEEPGTVLCWVYQNGNYNTGGAAFAPYDIEIAEEDPADLFEFWENQFADLAAIPIDPVLTLESEDDYSTTYRINLGHLDGRRVYGYISIPIGAGPFPAVLELPPYGDSPNIAGTDEIFAERGGAIAMSISIHNAEPDEEDPNSYEPDVMDDQYNYYYRYAVLAAVRAIDYIFTRDDFDGENLGVNGPSQGGGLTLLVAGLDQRVKAIAHSNSALCEHDGFKYDNSSGFPYYLRSSDAQVGTSEHLEATSAAAKYYDAARFARYFTGPSLSFIGLEDTICPPATTFAAFNRLPGPKVLAQGRETGHSHPSEYQNGRYDFFRYQFPAMLDAPWPWSDTCTGYFVSAGPNFDVVEMEMASLTAYSQFNDIVHDDLPIQWRQISGVGQAVFTDPLASNTTVVFDEPGTYVLEYKVNDPYPAESDKFYTLIDYVEVIVLEDQTDATTTLSSIQQFDVLPNPSSGHFRVSSDWQGGEGAQLTLTNIKGEQLKQIQLRGIENFNIFDLSNYPSGVYYFHLKLDSGEESIRKVIKI